MKQSDPDEIKAKRASKRYWREISGKLYARLQYQDESDKWKEKLKPIIDKRTAQRVVEEMRRELEQHGAETLESDKMTFADLAERYERAKFTPTRFSNGVKVASVDRELELLRAMFNFAIENDWLIKNPFAKKKGIISKAAEIERERTLAFDEESKLLAACVDRRAHLKAILICALDTGMRSGEIFRMRWREVDTKVGEIYIPKENTKIDAERTVGMTPRLKAELESL